MSRAIIGHTTVDELLSSSLRTVHDVYPDEPYYREDDPETGEPRWGLGHKSFQLVVQGYACARCTTYYDGIYRPRCPVCGYERDVSKDFFEEPDYWKPDPKDPRRRA